MYLLNKNKNFVSSRAQLYFEISIACIHVKSSEFNCLLLGLVFSSRDKVTLDYHFFEVSRESRSSVVALFRVRCSQLVTMSNDIR
jgi:hypothetical protein